MQESELACLNDERVKKEIAAMELPNDAVVCVEPWTYSPDGTADMSLRRIMVSPLYSSSFLSFQEYD
jgi:primary-amine oxidase